MERRLGRRMPPSYREFLRVTDGWQHVGGFVTLPAGTAEARWHDNESGLADMFEGYLDEDSGPDERREAELWRRGLQLDVESDGTYVVLDPEDVDEDGEWAVYTWAGRRAAPPERIANFGEFMREMHREFHRLRANLAEGEPEFVNDTTRQLDAGVEQARLDALRGGWEQAERALDRAKEYGRPRAAGMGDQIRRLLGQTYRVSFEGLASDPRYAPDLVPPLVAEQAAHSYRDDSTLEFDLRGATAAVVSLAYATLEQARNGAYRYAPTGQFGEAVEQARESARWGDTDGAWRTLMDALPLAAAGPRSPGARGMGCGPLARPPADPGTRRRTALHPQRRPDGRHTAPGGSPGPGQLGVAGGPGRAHGPHLLLIPPRRRRGARGPAPPSGGRDRRDAGRPRVNVRRRRDTPNRPNTASTEPEPLLRPRAGRPGADAGEGRRDGTVPTGSHTQRVAPTCPATRSRPDDCTRSPPARGRARPQTGRHTP